jgi:hypothetical protein
MAEYAGYVATQPIDFGKIGTGLVSNVIDLQERKRVEDEKALLQQEKLQEKQDLLLASETEKAMAPLRSGFKAVSAPTIKEIKFKAVDGIANRLQELENLQKSGQISKMDAKIERENLVQDVNDLKSSIDGYASAEQRIIADAEKQSPLGRYFNEIFLQTGDLENTSPIIKDKRLMFAKIDPVTQEVIEGTESTPGIVARYDKFQDEIVNYDLAADKFKVATYDVLSNLGTRGLLKTSSMESNPEYKNAKDTFIASYVATPYDVARVLSEREGYDFYRTDSEKKEKLKANPNAKLIFITKDANGFPAPVIDEKMKEEAVGSLNELISAKTGQKKSVTTNPNAIKTTGGGGGKPKVADVNRATLRQVAVNNLTDIQSKGKDSEAAKDIANDLNNKGYSITNIITIPGGVKYVDANGKTVYTVADLKSTFKAIHPSNKSGIIEKDWLLLSGSKPAAKSAAKPKAAAKQKTKKAGKADAL